MEKSARGPIWRAHNSPQSAGRLSCSLLRALHLRPVNTHLQAASLAHKQQPTALFLRDICSTLPRSPLLSSRPKRLPFRRGPKVVSLSIKRPPSDDAALAARPQATPLCLASSSRGAPIRQKQPPACQREIRPPSRPALRLGPRQFNASQPASQLANSQPAGSPISLFDLHLCIIMAARPIGQKRAQSVCVCV